MQKPVILFLFIFSLCTASPALCQEVLFRQKDLMKTNLVVSCCEYKIHKKDTMLISITDYTKSGQIEMQKYFEKGKETLKRIFQYDSTNMVKQEIIIRNQTDTTIIIFSSSNPFLYVEILTGGIPDYFPTETFYENGLLKSTTAINSAGKEVTFFYKYSYFSTKLNDNK